MVDILTIFDIKNYPSNKNFRTSAMALHFRADGILHVNVITEQEVTAEQVKETVDFTKNILKGERVPHLITTEKPYVIPNNEAREYLASKHREEISCADAYILKSLAQKIIAKFYIRINKPRIPTNFFYRQ
ncbi:hypothetical protein FLAV_02279 [Flavobacteriales bacterium]|nr:hypothetical protein FLAV_02279 [Flavobacteriales bacterium]